jgi:hypothetical protein
MRRCEKGARDFPPPARVPRSVASPTQANPHRRTSQAAEIATRVGVPDSGAIRVVLAWDAARSGKGIRRTETEVFAAVFVSLAVASWFWLAVAARGKATKPNREEDTPKDVRDLRSPPPAGRSKHETTCVASLSSRSVAVPVRGGYDEHGRFGRGSGCSRLSFAGASIRRIRFLISGVTSPFFGLRGRDFQRQKRRSPGDGNGRWCRA